MIGLTGLPPGLAAFEGAFGLSEISVIAGRYRKIIYIVKIDNRCQGRTHWGGGEEPKPLGTKKKLDFEGL